MLKDAVAVIDIGSSKVTCLIGENGVNNNFIIRAFSECQHEAFYDGKIEDFQSLSKAVSTVLNEVTATAKAYIDEIYVGVPGEFLRIINKQHRLFFNRKKRIKKANVDEFYEGAAKTVTNADYEIIDKSAVYYFLDGNNRVPEIIGKVSSSVSGYLTFFLASRSFVTSIKTILSGTKIKKINFVPAPLAEAKLLFSREERYAYAVLVDVGYITTSVSVILGDGLLYQGAFPMGGGHITAYLLDRLNVEFNVAEKIKRKINLSISPIAEGYYDVVDKDEQLSFSVRTCNDVARAVIDGIAENIDKLLIESQVRLPHNISVSLTGGGLSFIRGAREYLAKRLEMGVNIVTPNIPYMQKADETSRVALLNYALNNVFA